MLKKFKKGQYEDAVEYAKELIDAGIGAKEIKIRTKLDENQIRKIMEKNQKN
ncbi:hypothetical protein ACER0A_008745 [Haloimpatiens sp. FM7315]|uniref:hypothetical protein n=1 Tax=Haloimpatiens sp. FM7315 TaxID=3298609 RepID=UPI0035A2EF86